MKKKFEVRVTLEATPGIHDAESIARWVEDRLDVPDEHVELKAAAAVELNRSARL